MTLDRQTEAFTVATDDLIASMIRGASGRLAVIAPAVSCVVANAICERSQTLPSDAITLVLDSDPEVYRLGYGELKALEALQKVAAECGITIGRQPGVRIGVVIADDQTLIYMPTARLVEAGQNTHGGANAIRLKSPPRAMEADLGLSAGLPPQIGRNSLTMQDVANINNDLSANPPQKFDLARKVRVFNSFIEFVQLEVEGAQVSRRKVTIPSYLLAVADARTRDQLQATFRLVPPTDKLSGAEIAKDRRLFTGRFLHVIPQYGTVVLRRDKDALLSGVKKLEAAVAAFAERVRAEMQERINKNIAELIKSFLPALAKRPPKEWMPSSGERPDRATIQELLQDDLKEAFGTAEQLIRAMKVSCMFMGVTYELLNDPDFIAAATDAIPELQRFHQEFDAAKQADDPAHASKSTEVRLP